MSDDRLLDVQNNARMARVFLSYARTDQGFAQRLAAALAVKNCVANFDRSEFDPTNIQTGLSAEDDWWSRLKEMIAGAEATILVLSPASSTSKVCAQEIAHARALGKRVIPVLIAKIDFEVATSEVAALNIKLSFENDGEFDQSLAALVSVVNVDVAWHRDGLRLMEMVSRWEEREYPERLLLSPDATADADAWTQRRPATAKAPGELTIRYLSESRAKAKRERDRMLLTIGRAFVQPGERAVADRRYDAALRVAAGAMITAQDTKLERVPEQAHYSLLAAERSAISASLRGHQAPVSFAMFAPRGERALTASLDGTLGIWDLPNGSLNRWISVGCDGVQHAAYSHDGMQIVAATTSGPVIVFEADSAKEVIRFNGHLGRVVSATFSPDGTRVLSASWDGTVRLWDVLTGRQLSIVSSRANIALSFAVFSPNGTRILTGSSLEPVCVWDALAQRRLAGLPFCMRSGAIKGHVLVGAQGLGGAMVAGLSQVRSLSFKDELEDSSRAPEISPSVALSPDGRFVITTIDAEGDGEPLVDAKDVPITIIGDRKSEIEFAALSPDGGRVATASRHKEASLWDAKTGRLLGVLAGHEAPLTSVQFSPNGRSIISASSDGSARIWDAAATREIVVASVSGHPVNLADGGMVMVANHSAAISPDGKTLLVTHMGARTCDVDTGRELIGFRGNVLGSRAQFSADGLWLAAAVGGVATIWETASGKRMLEARGPDFSMRDVRLSPDKSMLASFTNECATIWRISNGAAIRTIDLPRDAQRLSYFTSAEFVANQRRLLLTVDDSSSPANALIVDIESGQTLDCSDMFGSGLFAVPSDDGSLVAIANGRESWIVDASTGRPVLSFGPIEGGVATMSVNVVAQKIATVSKKGALQLWSLETGSLEATSASSVEPWCVPQFSIDGSLVAAREGIYAKIFQVRTAQTLCVVEHDSGVVDVNFAAAGSRFLTLTESGLATVWDISRLDALHDSVALIVAAHLANGIGFRTTGEQSDLLMQSCPDDLFEELSQRLPDSARERLSEKIKDLRRPFHPRCYLSPTQRGDGCTLAP